jgi:hypothetical protein
MSSFSRNYPGLRPGQYREIGIPARILIDFPDESSVRMFATPSLTYEAEGYYLQAIKDRKAGWGNGSCTIVCSCLDSMFRAVLALSGRRTPCKHARGLRVLLKGRPRAWKKIED